MESLSDFVDLLGFFERCRKEERKNPGRFHLVFKLANASARANCDLIQGIKNLKIFVYGEVSFVGKTYNDPLVSVKFKDIDSVSVVKHDEQVTVLVSCKYSTIRYRIIPGPDR